MVVLPEREKHSIVVGVPGGQAFDGYLTGTSAASVNVPESASGPIGARAAPDDDAVACREPTAASTSNRAGIRTFFKKAQLPLKCASCPWAERPNSYAVGPSRG